MSKFIREENTNVGHCFDFQRGVPGSIRELLKLLIEEEVTIVLESGETERVEIEAVVGNLLVTSVDCESSCGNFKFIDIDCICAVIVECEDILENIFRGKRKSHEH